MISKKGLLSKYKTCCRVYSETFATCIPIFPTLHVLTTSFRTMCLRQRALKSEIQKMPLDAVLTAKPSKNTSVCDALAVSSLGMQSKKTYPTEKVESDFFLITANKYL